MSLSPNEKYPGATEADPNYKDSKFKDNNPSTTNNGSPLKALDRNEQLALQEAMMNAAGFDYNGVVDTPQNSQMFNAYKAALSNGANLLSNHNFIIASPDDSQPAPSATPTSYPPGYEIFSGVFANETTGILNLTYIDGRVSFSGGDFYMAVPNTGALENITEFVASVADFDGKPRTRGVSYALVGDEYRVTVGVDALEDESANETLLGSVKFEQGSVATGHEVQLQYRFVSTGSTTERSLNDRFADVVNVKDFGAKGDGVVDDTVAIQNALNTGKNVTLPSGNTFLISDSLVPKNNQTVYAYGATVHTNAEIHMWSAVGQLRRFCLLGGDWTSAHTTLSRFFDADGLPGNGNGLTECVFRDLNISSVDVAFRFENCRDVVLDNIRADCSSALQYLDKSAEVVVQNCIFSSAAWAGRTPRDGIYCAAGTTGYPEGLTVSNTLLYRFPKNLLIDDLFVGQFIGNFFDSIDQDPNIIGNSDSGRVDGISFESNWFYERGLELGVSSNTSPKGFRTRIVNNYFSGMEAGVDVRIQRFVHGVTISNNHHGSRDVGTHVGYVCHQDNENISIDNCNFEYYDSYVQMNTSGQYNSISNIQNRDDLATPVSVGYPVNVYNVEGYGRIREADIVSGSYVGGSEIARVNVPSLSSGTHYVSFDIRSLNAPSSGALQLRAFNTGSNITNPDIEITTLCGWTTYNAGDEPCRMTIPIHVRKATSVDITLLNEGSSPTISISGFANGLFL